MGGLQPQRTVHKKAHGQIYIQTWHGSLPLKRLEKDYPALSAAYLKNAARDSRMTDLCLSNGEFMNDIYRTAFGYECEIQVTGSARMDPLLHPNSKRVIRTKEELLRIAGHMIRPVENDTNSENETAANIKFAVYAPTYREGGAAFDMPDLEKVADALEKRFGGIFYIVTRMHPLVAEKSTSLLKGAFGSGRIINADLKGDLYELLEASQVLITDYSNTLFEFGMCGKPVFLYAPDAAEYERERGFYFDYEKLPFPHSTDTVGLCESIASFSAFDYKNGLSLFYKNIGVQEDGRASRRIAELILRKVYRE